MELRHLRYFIAVAEELSFSRAAKRLFLSQPPLSRQIKNLEEELGFSLFERSTRSVHLTNAGAAFLPRARNSIYEAQAAIADARRTAEGYGEVITLGFMSAIMLTRVTEVLAGFHRKLPAIDVQFRQMRSDEQWEAIIDDRIDVGFVDLGIAAMSERLKTEDIASSIFLHEPLQAAVPKGHHLAGQKTLSLYDLRNERFSILDRHLYPSHFDMVLSACKAAGFSPRIVHHGNQMPTALAYVAAGMSVCIAPALAASLWADNVCFIGLKEKPFIDIHMIYKKTRMTPGIKLLCQTFSESYK